MALLFKFEAIPPPPPGISSEAPSENARSALERPSKALHLLSGPALSSAAPVLLTEGLPGKYR